MSVGDAAVRRTLDRTVVRPAWVVLAAVAVPFALGVDLPLWAQYLPLAASALVFGLPHGAVDHLATARVANRAFDWQVAVAVGLLYGVLGGAYLAVWFLAPVAAAVFFVAMTWFHWGQGDVYLLSAVSDGAYPRSPAHRVLVLVVRGAMPMAVPLLGYPAAYRRVVEAWVGLFGADAAVLAPLFAVEARLVLGVALGGLSVLAVLWGRVAAPPGDAPADEGVLSWLPTATDAGPASSGRWVVLDAVETGVLWVFFLAVPPILAVGLYFCLWHSVRHIARLALLDDRSVRALRVEDVGTALGRFARDAAPLTAVSLAFLGGLYVLVPRGPGDLEGLVALYLVLIAVLTLPHVAVVTYMDHRQGVWTG